MKIKVAATHMSCSWKIEENISKAEILIDKAAKKGANIILLQELFKLLIFVFNMMKTYLNLPKPSKTTKY